MNAVSPGTASKWPSFQPALAAAMRSCELEMKFRQMCRVPSMGTKENLAADKT
jgi:hypothetical protein